MKLARVPRGYEMPFWSMGFSFKGDMKFSLDHRILRGSSEAPISGD